MRYKAQTVAQHHPHCKQIHSKQRHSHASTTYDRTMFLFMPYIQPLQRLEEEEREIMTNEEVYVVAQYNIRMKE